jgi:hypothetical protein
MTEEKCKSCQGSTGIQCNEIGVLIKGCCEECEGTGRNLKTYWALLLTHKNIGEHIWMHPTLFDTLAEAQRFKHREFLVVKVLEVRV